MTISPVLCSLSCFQCSSDIYTILIYTVCQCITVDNIITILYYNGVKSIIVSVLVWCCVVCCGMARAVSCVCGDVWIVWD